MSPEKPANHPLRGPANLEDGDSDSASMIGSHPSRAEAIGRLEQLRKVVPVFAHELVSARREAAQLRTENASLHEQLREGQGHPDPSSLAEAQTAAHRRDQSRGEAGGRTGRRDPPARSGKPGTSNP